MVVSHIILHHVIEIDLSTEHFCNLLGIPPVVSALQLPISFAGLEFFEFCVFCDRGFENTIQKKWCINTTCEIFGFKKECRE